MLLFANNAGSTLAAIATISDVSIQVAPGDGARFPTPAVGESFIATIQQGVLFEIVACTARVGDVLTVTRAREGTTAQTWGLGASVSMRPTAGTMAAFEQRARALASFAPINGPIVLTANPTLSTHAARKAYVDARETAIRTDLNAAISATALVGEVKEWPGVRLPPRFVWAVGQELSRTTYSQLFEELTSAITVTLTAGSPVAVVTGGSTAGLSAGMPVSLATYFAPGTTITSFAGGITLSSNALLSGSGLTLRVCPHGVGNNTTTFNNVDRRGTFGLGRSDMGGTDPGRVTTAVAGFNPARLGVIGGSQRLHQHLHGITQTPHGHPISDPGHAHGLDTNVANLVGGITTFSGPGPGQLGAGGVAGTAFTGVSVTANNANITINNAGDGNSENIPPSTVTNYIVFTNVL